MDVNQFRRPNGRFAKKKVVDKELKCVAAMAKVNKSIVSEKNLGVCGGPRIVDITELAKNLKCCNCKRTLDLENIISDDRAGLHSRLTVVCKDCQTQTKVPTGRVVKIEGKSYAENNLGLIMGNYN